MKESASAKLRASKRPVGAKKRNAGGPILQQAVRPKLGVGEGHSVFTKICKDQFHGLAGSWSQDLVSVRCARLIEQVQRQGQQPAARERSATHNTTFGRLRAYCTSCSRPASWNNSQHTIRPRVVRMRHLSKRNGLGP